MRQFVCRATTLSLGGLALTGCALSVPMPGGTDMTPTGSIRAANPSPFSSEMDGEDWRRAKSALDTALDPQGNGASVSWSNPQSGAKGTFTPTAQPVPKDDGICRTFVALLDLKGKDERKLRSSACRRNGGDWIVGQIEMDRRIAQTKKTVHLADGSDVSHLKE